MSVADHPEPWNRAAVGVMAVLVGLGPIGLFVGWYGISDTADIEEQARWLGLGIGSLILAGFGMVLWLLFGLLSVNALRREVVRDLKARQTARAVDANSDIAENAPVGRFGIASGMRRYHRAECDILVGKGVRWLDSESLHSSDAVPCGMCKPDEASA